jgi:LDH2 family malate/lactate/ureidoglycolate dehydrogenase
MIVTETELFDVVNDILRTAGTSEENARSVALHLVESNLSGVDTHGIIHLPYYVDDIHKGLLDPTARPEVLQQRPTSALVTGNWTFGQVAAEFATQLGIALALENDVAVVGLVQSHHIGRLGHFTEMAARSDVLSQVWAGGYSEEAPMTMPFGGRGRLLHTNPISMGFPAGEEPRVMFDFATTTIAGTKVDNARRRGEQVPAGAIVDRDGQPTTDPAKFFDGGGHVSFGGHKGYAIGYAAELFGRVLTGSGAYADPNRAGPVLRSQGVTFIFIRADLFQPMEAYAASADEMERRTRAIPPAEGVAEVLVPGDPEWRTRLVRRRDGIPVEDAIWERIVALPRTTAPSSSKAKD